MQSSNESANTVKWAVWISPLADCNHDDSLWYFQMARQFVVGGNSLTVGLDAEEAAAPFRTLESIKTLEEERLWNRTPTAEDDLRCACLGVQNTYEMERSIRAGAHVVYIHPECHGLIFQITTLASSISTYRKVAMLSSVATLAALNLLPSLGKRLPEFVLRHLSEKVLVGVGAVMVGYSCLRHFWLSTRIGKSFSNYDVVKFKLPNFGAAHLLTPSALHSSATPFASRQASLAQLGVINEVALRPAGQTTVSSYVTPVVSPDGSTCLHLPIPMAPSITTNEASEPSSVASSTLELRLSSPDQDALLSDELDGLGMSSIIEANPLPGAEEKSRLAHCSNSDTAFQRHFVLIRADTSAFYSDLWHPLTPKSILASLKSLYSVRILGSSFWTGYMPRKWRRHRSVCRYGLYAFSVYIIKRSVVRMLQ